MTSSVVLHPTAAVIDLSAFRHNLAMVRAYVGSSVGIMPVVKADAYGHGAVRLSEEALNEGVGQLAVARYHEGVALRQAGIEAPLLVFEVVPRDFIETSIAHGLMLTVCSEDYASVLSGLARRSGNNIKIHINVDTGMGRLGIQHETAVPTIERIARLPGITIEGVYSHFATSEAPDQSFAREQLGRFESLLSGLERRKIPVPLRHMANSGAVIALEDAHFDLVRPGIMLYGYTPGHAMPQKHAVRPVMSLRSQVSQIKVVDPGTSISYGRRYVTTRRTMIATIPIGYADGFARLLTNRSECVIRGRRYPVVGTVCMDHIMADVGEHSGVGESDPVTLIGRDGGEEITAWDIASTVGTIPYEVTCLVTPRVPRVYIS